jgi:hypothetical protein
MLLKSAHIKKASLMQVNMSKFWDNTSIKGFNEMFDTDLMIQYASQYLNKSNATVA